MDTLFPKFLPIDQRSRKHIMSFTNKFKPYSDFNFNNLSAWNYQNARQYTFLNKNLVIIFSDYRTDDLFISFIGQHKITSTAKTLLSYATENGYSDKLRFIPMEVAVRVQSKRLVVKEDPSNDDYLFSIDSLATADKSLKKKNKLAIHFEKKYPKGVFSCVNVIKLREQQRFSELFKKWSAHRVGKFNDFDSSNELLALERLLKLKNNKNMLFSYLEIGESLVAFSVDEILSNHYALSHFIKADVNYKGVYEFINKKVAQELKKRNCRWWNWEQDLNLPGLKQMKESYRPIGKLKKFIIYKT